MREAPIGTMPQRQARPEEEKFDHSGHQMVRPRPRRCEEGLTNRQRELQRGAGFSGWQ